MDKFRLGIDVGGTFTDLVLLADESGAVTTEKVLTTPHDPSEGVLAGVDKVVSRGMSLSKVYSVIHGTTLVANALIERKGAKTGLITTAGFRDILHFVGRELRYDMFDPDIAFPKPLVPRALRQEVPERVGSDGKVIKPLDERQARETVKTLLESRVEAIAVCFLQSYVYPEHERMLRRLILAEHPEMPISLSHEVLPQMREYERTSATVMNAFVQPLMGTYLKQLEAGLQERGFVGNLFLMTSSGGLVSRETAEAFPIQLVESGPAAGALAAIFAGKHSGEENVLSFDMGGTTAKAAIIKDGRALVSKSHEVARVRRFKKGSGLPVGIPVLDLLEIGAGGGSIAEINNLGLLQVGPRSAGADPGPVCYQHGGTEPTVTDADVVLGFLNPDFFLGGEMALDKAAARQAIETKIGQPLGLDRMRAAAAISRIVIENMAEAARVHSVEMNVDIRRHGLIAFGGAGPVHAYGVARRLGAPFVMCPREAGVLSSLGLLVAPLAVEFSRTAAEDLEFLTVAQVANILHDLEQKGKALLEQAGVGEYTFERSVDMHYIGQGFEVATSITDVMLTPGGLQLLKSRFDETYMDRYGIKLASLPARTVTWRVLASGPTPEIRLGTPDGGSVNGQGLKGHRAMFFPEYGAVEYCAVYSRPDLVPGDEFEGPAAIEEKASTVILPPGARGRIDDQLNIIFTVSG